ncbi:hypothetical protein [Emcibacter sp. SYSU 3D8]|uniref:hypothetical protein n=1 Tax=Emcibacter sp. SYSU 3D8 TaxID=3133969 RepID=UPI0031FF3535
MRTLVVAGLATIAMASCAQAAEPVKMYPFEKATLTYAVTGAQQGTQTITIKDFGRTTAQHYEATVPSAEGPQQINVSTFTDPQWIYTYDFAAKQGTRVPNEEAAAAASAGSGREFFEQLTLAQGGKRVGMDTFNGTPCTIWDMGGNTGTRLCIDDRMVMQYMRTSTDMMQGSVELQSARIGMADESSFERPQAIYEDVDMSRRREN